MQRTTIVSCQKCQLEHEGGKRKCSCGFPLPPPVRLLWNDMHINSHEQIKYRKTEEDLT